MPYKEKEIEKKYFSIGEVAEAADCATSAIRFWEIVFSLNIRKNRKGNRIFDKKKKELIVRIATNAREGNLTLKGIAYLLGLDYDPAKLYISD